jgi:hypothetical protein
MLAFVDTFQIFDIGTRLRYFGYHMGCESFKSTAGTTKLTAKLMDHGICPIATSGLESSKLVLVILCG